MKKNMYSRIVLFALVTVILGSLISACGEIVKGNGNVITEDRSISSFDGIRIGGNFEIFLEQGSVESLRIEADENLMGLIKTEVRSGKLIIHIEENVIRAESMKAYITFVNIEDIDISGACELIGVGMLNFDDIEIEASGATEIDLNLHADYLELDLSGSSEVDLEGDATEMSLEISGAGELFAEDFILQTCDISISGAGSAVINVSDILDIDISGAASVKYKGQPKVSQRVSGAAKIRNID